MEPGRRSAGRATLQTVAHAAGVSVATVSKVVNGKSDVASETRKRIQQLLLEQEYTSPTSRGNSASATVCVVFDAMRSPNNMEILRGAMEVAGAVDVGLLVALVPVGQSTSAWAQNLATGGPGGLVLVTTQLSAEEHEAFRLARVPLVLIDPINPPDFDAASAGATNFTGGLEATNHLISLGHRRIGFIEGARGALASVARLHGYHAALSQVGAPNESLLIQPGDFTFSGGFAAAITLLSLPERPTAIFAANDLQALGAIEAARTLDLLVPQDLSVVGFDDMAAAQWASPPLTTVRQPFADMGRVAVEMLLRIIEGDALPSQRVELATSLVVRQSTAARPELVTRAAVPVR